MVSPIAVLAGESVTLTWSSQIGACVAGDAWSGAKPSNGTTRIGPLIRATTFSLTCGAERATASVTVANGNPVPSPTATRVVSDSLATSLTYRRVNLKATDLVWDARQSQILVITKSDSPIAPNSLVAVDPVSGATQAVALGAPAVSLAVSADGQYVYVGFFGGGAIRRFLAAGLVPDVAFSVGNADSVVLQIKVSPIAPRTIAVIANGLGTGLVELPGIVIVDDTVPRPEMVHGSMVVPGTGFDHIINIADIHWSDDATRAVAVMQHSLRGILDLTVTPQGISMDLLRPWPLVSAGSVHGERFYSSDSRVFDLTGAVEQLGRMADSGNPWQLRVVSPSRGKAFSVERHLLPGNFADSIRINAFDSNTFEYIDSITFNGDAAFESGRIITWGDTGLAMGGEDALLVASGTFAASGGIPPPVLDTPAIVTNRTVSNTGGSMHYRVLELAADDVATNACGRLFVATSRFAWLHPSSVVEIDWETGGALRAVQVRGEPFYLAASDDCSTLYAGLDASNAVARIRLEDMTVDALLPLGVNPTGLQNLHGTRSLGVAPGLPHTLAVSKSDFGSTLCSGTGHGLAIYDGVMPRPVEYTNPSSHFVKAIAWGANASTLYGEGADGAFAFDVDASGAGNPRPLFPYLVGTLIYDLGRDLHFDRSTNRLYNAFGQVFDATANVEIGRVPLPDGAAIVNSCGTPSLAHTSDASSGKLFYVVALTGAEATLGVSSFSSRPLALAGRAEITLSAGPFPTAMRVVRPGSDRLAAVTARGELVLMQGSLLEP